MNYVTSAVRWHSNPENGLGNPFYTSLRKGDSHLKHRSLTSTILCLNPTARPISFTHPPVASMWFVTLHSLSLYSDPSLLCRPPSYWLRLFWIQNVFRINSTFLKPSQRTQVNQPWGGSGSHQGSQIRQGPGPERYPEQGSEALPTASGIPPGPDFQCDPSHPSLPYSVETRPSDLYT